MAKDREFEVALDESSLGNALRNKFEGRTYGTGRSQRRGELYDAGLTGMDEEQADWEQGLEDDEDDQ